MPEKRGSMNSGKGLYSSKDNPLPNAKRVAPEAGPGSNPDQQKVNRMMKKAEAEKDSLRGKSGM
jgi:hypothetical protein